mmetsp:Transcript_41237/g.92267  ORF Transcript_41237/g.92267 Transcript_41237/m.92267 type:complete len:119 (+) Transcript_41237:519-875(+)
MLMCRATLRRIACLPLGVLGTVALQAAMVFQCVIERSLSLAMVMDHFVPVPLRKLCPAIRLQKPTNSTSAFVDLPWTASSSPGKTGHNAQPLVVVVSVNEAVKLQGRPSTGALAAKSP